MDLFRGKWGRNCMIDKYEFQLQQVEEMEKSWVKEKEIIQRKQLLIQERNSIIPKKKISTMKLLVGFMLLNLTAIEIYSMWVMYALSDLSALYSLITAVIGETITVIAYSVKSTKENTYGGIVYDSVVNSRNVHVDEMDETVG